MKKFVVAALLPLLAACTAPESPVPGLQKTMGTVESPMSRWDRAFGPNFPPANPGEAALYIVRGAAPPEAPPINITMGNQSMGALAGPSWMRFDLPPSLYDLRAYGTQANSELIITVAPGQTRFLLAVATDTGNAHLLELEVAEGRKLVRQGQGIQTLR